MNAAFTTWSGTPPFRWVTIGRRQSVIVESLFARYRNILLLLLALFGQILLLAWQVKSDNDIPLVRVWAVSAVTPVASLLENIRHGTTGFFSNYFELRDAREQSRDLRSERDRLKVENQILKVI